MTDLFTTLGAQVKFIDITPLLPRCSRSTPPTSPRRSRRRRTRPPPTCRPSRVPNVLLVNDDLDANTACVLTKTLFDTKDELIKANAAANGINLDTARDTDPYQLNRGAATALDQLGAN